VVLLAGCGGSNKQASPEDALPGATTLYESGDWAVVARGPRAVAAHRVDGEWAADDGGRVKIRVLGPAAESRVARMPQVAVELTAPAALVESALWVDGTELLVKGGGSPTRGTIYGAPARPLSRGKHVAVAYARTATDGSALAWTFTV
jgi:hypothetical protein